MKLVIFGSRSIDNYDEVKAILTETINYMWPQDIEEIVSGGARGADHIGEKWAAEHGLPVTMFIADWDKYSKAAGPLRNQDMAEYADAGLAIWDGESKGTLDMLDRMYRLKKHVTVIQQEED